MTGVSALELITGGESKQFALLMWFSFFSQASGPTAIINFAPMLLHEVGYSISDSIVTSAALGTFLGLCHSVLRLIVDITEEIAPL